MVCSKIRQDTVGISVSIVTMCIAADDKQEADSLLYRHLWCCKMQNLTLVLMKSLSKATLATDIRGRCSLLQEKGHVVGAWRIREGSVVTEKTQSGREHEYVCVRASLFPKDYIFPPPH